MEKGKKKYYLTGLGAIFLLGGVLSSLNGGDGHEFIYFGIGTLVATVLYYGIMIDRPQITSFILGLIIMHSGVLLIVKGTLTYPLEFGLITFTGGILILLNSGFSEYIRDRKKQG